MRHITDYDRQVAHREKLYLLEAMKKDRVYLITLGLLVVLGVVLAKLLGIEEIIM